MKRWTIFFMMAAIGFIALRIESVGSATTSGVSTASFKQLYLCSVTKKAVCKLGSIGPGGGTIFYVDSTDIYSKFDYLEAAPVGWSGGSDPQDPALQWCSDITNIIQKSNTVWDSRRVGQGKANTQMMLAACSSGAANEVAKFNNRKLNSLSDWFLPSLGELMIMSQNLQGLGDLTPSDYWSSSEYSAVGGWVESISHGYQGSAAKNTTFKVRPIRSF